MGQLTVIKKCLDMKCLVQALFLFDLFTWLSKCLVIKCLVLIIFFVLLLA